MLLSDIKIPKNKNELIRKFQSLKNIKFEIYDDVKRSDVGKLKYNIERYIGNDEVCVIILKSK